MLTPQGKFLYDLLIYSPPRLDEKSNRTRSGPGERKSEMEVYADVDASVLDKLLDTIKKYRLRSKVDIESMAEALSCWQRYGSDLAEESPSVEEPEAASVSWGARLISLPSQLHEGLVLGGSGTMIPD